MNTQYLIYQEPVTGQLVAFTDERELWAGHTLRYVGSQQAATPQQAVVDFAARFKGVKL